MPWVPIHESEFADSVDFDYYGAVTFADSIVTQSEWGGRWRIALPTYLPLPFGDRPAFRVTVLEWSGSFPEDPFITPLSWGFYWMPEFVWFGFELAQFNESPTPNSEWVPSPFEIWFPSPSMGDDFAIVQYASFGEWDEPTSAQWLVEVWQGDPSPPEGECFWTDLVNVTQVCGETPPEPEYPMEVTLRCRRGPPTPAGYTHSTGLDPTDSVGSPRSYAALAGAVSVELLAVSEKELPSDPSDFSEWSAPIPLDDGYFDGATVLDPPGVFVVNEYGYWTFGSNDPSVGNWRVGVVRVTTADSVATYSVLLDWGGFG